MSVSVLTVTVDCAPLESESQSFKDCASNYNDRTGVKNPLVREILKAKFPEPGGGCNVERSRMRRAIHDTVSNVIHDHAEPLIKASEAGL